MDIKVLRTIKQKRTLNGTLRIIHERLQKPRILDTDGDFRTVFFSFSSASISIYKWKTVKREIRGRLSGNHQFSLDFEAPKRIAKT